MSDFYHYVPTKYDKETIIYMGEFSELIARGEEITIKDIRDVFPLNNAQATQFKLDNGLYKWQRKNDPCDHDFTKICRHGCFIEGMKEVSLLE